MAWEENSRICINMLLIAILSRTGVTIILTKAQLAASMLLCATVL